MKKYLLAGVFALAVLAIQSPKLAFADVCAADATPSITVVSPSGGEVYTAGQTITVQWTSCGITGSEVGIGLDFPDAWLPSGVTTTAMTASNIGTASVPLPGPSMFTPSGFLQYGNYYKVVISDGSTGNLVQGFSTGTFTINPAVSAPTVTTNPATLVTDTTAMLNGTISSFGGDPSVTLSFDYGTTTLYGNTHPIASLGISTGDFAGGQSGLTCNTTYHYRAVATNSAGTSYGDDATFTTAACDTGTPLTIATNAPVSVGDTSAVLSGTITTGTAESIGVQVGTTTSYGPSSLTVGTYGAGTYDLPTEHVLSCNTLYHYRFLASVDGVSNVYGDDMTFTTLPCTSTTPTVETMPATSIVTHSATFNASVANAQEGADELGYFDYGLTTDYGSVADISIPHTDGATFSVTTGYGLQCAATYHYRAAVTQTIHKDGFPDSISTFTGADMTLITADCPVLTTQAATNITKTSATISADLVSTDGESYQLGFEYGPTTAYGSTTPLSITYVTGVTAADLTGLSCGTTYHYKPNISFTEISSPYVPNVSTVYGDDMSFSTLPCDQITIETTAATSITQTSAILNGTAKVPEGTFIHRVFSYGTTTEYGQFVAVDIGVTGGSGTFSSNPITGLVCGTTYHFQAGEDSFEPNAVGADMTFTTSPCTTSGGNGGGGGHGGGGRGCTLGKVDANYDCRVDILDFVILMAHWNEATANNIADFNNDGKVEMMDFVQLMANWTR